MNRLLRVSFDTLLTSVTPILGWFLLGILVDKNLINIFSLIYPMQFVISAIKSIFVIIMLFKIVQKTRFQINIVNCIKYDSVYLFAEISMFIIYLFGFKNSFSFGQKYVVATSFATLITDTQWDVADAIKTVAQIDIAKKIFSYKEHIKNSHKLVTILIISSFIMGMVLYPIYQTDITATLIFVGIELISLYLYPVYITKLTYIQLEYSAIKATLHKQISNILRIICSFIPSPFCTSIGLIISVLYQLLFTHHTISKNKLKLE